MRIDDYGFGSIVIDGQTYTKDVVICPSGVTSPWWRKEGHNLDVDDLGPAVAAGPDTLVVGTGYHGNMAVPETTLAYLRDKGVEVRVARTVEAVDLFNGLAADPARTVVAALHLTC